MEPIERLCLQCQKPLRGRTDKKFCDDYCRNAFNNQRNSAQSNYMRRIDHILRKNRRILSHILRADLPMIKCSKNQLLQQGFDLKFFTHQYINQKGNIYYFCYDYGYLHLPNEMVLIVRRKETFI